MGLAAGRGEQTDPCPAADAICGFSNISDVVTRSFSPNLSSIDRAAVNDVGRCHNASPTAARTPTTRSFFTRSEPAIPVATAHYLSND